MVPLLLALFVSDVAEAATRTIRGRIYFHNGRVQYSTGPGSLLRSTGSSGDAVASMSYVEYRVYARCDGQTVSGELRHAAKNGYFSQTFTNICSNPEFKMGVRFRSKPDDEVFHEVANVDGKPYSAWVPAYGYHQTSASDFENGQLWRSLNVSCRSEWKWECPTPDNSRTHRVANIYKTGVDVYERWGYYKHDVYGRFSVRYPRDDGSSSGAGRDNIWLNSDKWDQNHGNAHEFGHAYHKRAIDRTGSLSSSDWCSGHSWHYTKNIGTSTNPDRSEACATAEGWADFFGAATYFTSSASRPYYKYCGDECDSGSTASCSCGASSLSTACERQCRDGLPTQQLVDGPTWDRAWNPAMNGTTPRTFSCVRHPDAGSTIEPYYVEGNVARFFWDLYDTDTDDDINASLTKIRLVWDLFPTGFGNGKVDEPRNSSGDWDDPDGRNLRDYIRRWPTASERDDLEDILEANCLGQQTDQ